MKFQQLNKILTNFAITTFRNFLGDNRIKKLNFHFTCSESAALLITSFYEQRLTFSRMYLLYLPEGRKVSFLLLKKKITFNLQVYYYGLNNSSNDFIALIMKKYFPMAATLSSQQISLGILLTKSPTEAKSFLLLFFNEVADVYLKVAFYLENQL